MDTVQVTVERHRKRPEVFSFMGGLISTIPVLTERAATALGPFLDPATDELLPLESELGVLYALNVTAFVDCFDRDRSKFRLSTTTGEVASIREFAARPGITIREHFLRVPEDQWNIYYSGDVRRLLDEQELEGVNAKKAFSTS